MQRTKIAFVLVTIITYSQALYSMDVHKNKHNHITHASRENNHNHELTDFCSENHTVQAVSNRLLYSENIEQSLKKLLFNIARCYPCTDNGTEALKHILQLGCPPDTQDATHYTALHWACLKNNKDKIKLLLKYGANINAVGQDFTTPLHAIMLRADQYHDLIIFLVTQGADLNSTNILGKTPFDEAKQYKSPEFVERLRLAAITAQNTLPTPLKAINSYENNNENATCVNNRDYHNQRHD